MNEVYDDKNNAFVYSSRWQNEYNGKAYDGSYKQSDIKKDSSATLDLTGGSFNILYTAARDLGRMDIYLDDALIASIDEGSSTLHFQQHWDYSGTLTSGVHQLKLVPAGQSKAEITLDAVIVRS